MINGSSLLPSASSVMLASFRNRGSSPAIHIRSLRIDCRQDACATTPIPAFAGMTFLGLPESFPSVQRNIHPSS